MKSIIQIRLFGVFVSLTVLFVFSQFAFSQAIDLEDETRAEEPQEVIKLGPIMIELEPIKIFIIPRMGAELPYIDFTSIYLRDFNQPASDIFKLREEDIEPKALDFSDIFAKKRD